jgi:hypothetical protein
LRGQFDLVLIFADNFAESKVSDLDFAVVEDDVLRFQVVVNDLLLLIVQVLQARQDL